MMAFLRAWWLKAVIVLAVVLVAIQFVPYGVDNPKASDEPKWDSAQTRQLFMSACADCHSNKTKVLWFEHVAPVKWYIANHVKEGRDALNISQWHTAAGEGAEEMTEVEFPGRAHSRKHDSRVRHRSSSWFRHPYAGAASSSCITGGDGTG